MLFSLFSSRPISREKNCRQFALLSGQRNIPALAQRIVEEPEQLGNHRKADIRLSVGVNIE